MSDASGLADLSLLLRLDGTMKFNEKQRYQNPRFIIVHIPHEISWRLTHHA